MHLKFKIKLTQEIHMHLLTIFHIKFNCLLEEAQQNISNGLCVLISSGYFCIYGMSLEYDSLKSQILILIILVQL